MSLEYKGIAYHSAARCVCGEELWRLDPPISGWEYYCPRCKWLTAPRAELDKRLKSLEPGAIGIVSAIPCELSLVAGVRKRELTEHRGGVSAGRQELPKRRRNPNLEQAKDVKEEVERE